METANHSILGHQSLASGPLLIFLILAIFSLAGCGQSQTSSGQSPLFPLWDGHESIADYGKRVNLPLTKTLDLGNGVKLELVLIPAGKFLMGSPKDEYDPFGVKFKDAYKDARPTHEVTLTQPYYMGKFDVTQEQYQQVARTNPSAFKGKDNPVETVSWGDAQDFCKKLTEQSKQTVRLPTEAEWEYACRAGTKTKFYSGDTDEDLDRVAWHSGNGNATTHPVGQKAPNAFGLYDMHGNVNQWCNDWYAEDYYSKSPTENPQGPVRSANHIARGGSWKYGGWFSRAAKRGGYGLGDGDLDIGFRVVVASKSP